MVATATLSLVERGTISLDDEVTRFLPQFRPRLANGETPAITVRHLVTHTAGLTYGLFEPGGDGPYHRAKVSDGMDQPGSVDRRESRTHRLGAALARLREGRGQR